MTYKQYVVKMNDFKNLEWVRNQLQLAKKPNFWSILEYGEGSEYSAHEIRTSRMIRWLMDANETHLTGNLFAHKLISKFDKNYKYNPQKNKEIQSTAEKEDIDVFYSDLDQQVFVALEVKQHAKEGITSNNESQLDKYKNIVDEWKRNLDQNIKVHYIYLTPLGFTPTNPNWDVVGYSEFIQVIKEYMKELNQVNPPNKEDTLKIVTDFKEDLQRTLEFQRKDHQQICNELSNDEKKLTVMLTDGERIEALEQQLQSKGIDRTEFFEVVQLVQKYLYAQNHTPNKDVSLLMRKIYNYLSEQPIDTNKLDEPIKRGVLTNIKPLIICQYNLDFTKINLTSGKGQGLFLNSEKEEKRIYMSGDADGNFPNDGIQLITYDGKSKSIVRSKLLKRSDFTVVGSSLKDRNNQTVDFEALMERVLEAVKELNEL